MRSQEKLPSTLSGREVARQLKITIRRLSQLEKQAKISRFNPRIPYIKRRYKLREFKKMERILKREARSGAPVLTAFILMAVGLALLSLYLRDSSKDQQSNTSIVPTTRELPPQGKLKQGIHELRRGNYDKARSILQDLLNCGDISVEKEANYLYLETFKNDDRLYEQMLQQYLAKFPESDKSPDVMFTLGNLLMKKKSMEESKKLFSKVFEKYPEHELTPASVMNMIRILVIQTEYKDALEISQKLVYGYPDSPYAPQALYTTAMIYDGKLRKHVLALETLQALKDNYPSYQSDAVNMKIDELTRDWDNDGIISAIEMDKGTSDGEDPWNGPGSPE